MPMCRAIWGENHSNSVPTGLKMHIGIAQQRIRWGPCRMRRNAEAMKHQGSQRNEGQAEKNTAYVKKQQELSCAWTRSMGSCGECANPTASASTFECACGPGGTCQVMMLMKACGLELLMVKKAPLLYPLIKVSDIIRVQTNEIEV